MSFSKQLRKGRITALNVGSKPILFSFPINKHLKKQALAKCDKMGVNLSAYLRICVEKLVELPIDYHIENMYKEIIKDATKELFEKD